jgi:hypothetical protein
MTNALWAAAIVAACIAFGFGTTDPMAARWVAVYVISAAAVVFIAWNGYRFKKTHAWAMALYAWAWISLLWSPDWKEGLNQAKDATAILAVFLWATQTDLKRIENVVTFALACFLALYIAYPHIDGGFGNRNFASEFVLMAIPFAAKAAWDSRSLSGKALSAVVLLGAIGYLFGFNASSEKWAVLGAAGVLAFCFCVYMRAWITTGILATSGLAFLPVILAQSTLYSIGARLEFGWNTLVMWAAAPVFGHGWGSFNYVYPTYQQAHYRLFGDVGTRLGEVTIIAGNAHNELLQVGSELGLVGAVIAVGFGYRLFRHGQGWAVLSCLFVAGVVSMVSFPLRNPSTALIAAMAAGVAVQQEAPLRVLPSRRALAVPAGALLSLSLLLCGWFWFQAQVHFSNVRAYLLEAKPNPLAALSENVTALAYWPIDRQIRHQLILSVRAASSLPNVNLDPKAADRAYQISGSTAQRSPDTEFARVEYLINSGRWSESGEIDSILDRMRRSAPHLPQTWFSSAVISAFRGNYAEAKEQAQRALSMKYIPGVQVESLQRLLKELEKLS